MFLFVMLMAYHVCYVTRMPRCPEKLFATLIIVFILLSGLTSAYVGKNFSGPFWGTFWRTVRAVTCSRRSRPENSIWKLASIVVRVLAISHNFPHEEDLTCGIFADRQLTEMARQGADIVLMVPIIYAPEAIHRIGRYKDFGPTRKLIFDDAIQAYVQAFFRPPGRFFLPYDGGWPIGPSREESNVFIVIGRLM